MWKGQPDDLLYASGSTQKLAGVSSNKIAGHRYNNHNKMLQCILKNKNKTSIQKYKHL